MRVCNCVTQEIDGMGVEDRAFFRSESILGKVVFDGLDAVFTDAAKVQAYITRFSHDAPPGPTSLSSGSQGTGGHIGSLGSAPPIANVEKLICMQDITNMPKTIFTVVKHKKDYVPLKNDLMVAIAPVTALVAAAKARVTQINERKKARGGQKKDSKKGVMIFRLL